jgi:hypothetical protein
MAWIAPPILLLSAAIIARKLTWREHPALLLFLVSEAWIQVLMSYGWMRRDVAILIQLVVASTFLLGEMVRLNRIPLRPQTMAMIAALALAVCALHAGSQPWTQDYKLSLFRSDARIARAVEALCILAFRWKVPALERRDQSRITRVYSVGVAAWLVVEAIQGAFVRGGIGMALLPYTPQRWVWVGLVTYCGVIGAAVGTALAMTIGSPGRKHAAKDTKGRTRTGLIEMDRRSAA